MSAPAIRNRKVIGHYDYRHNRDQEEEWCSWIGKPWRRLEYLRQRVFYKGECIDTTRTWSLAIGLRRIGLHLHVSLTRQVGMDYSDWEHQ